MDFNVLPPHLCGGLAARLPGATISDASELGYQYPLFRIHNEWYYLLRSMLVTSGTTGRRQFIMVDTVQADAVVEIAGPISIPE